VSKLTSCPGWLVANGAQWIKSSETSITCWRTRESAVAKPTACCHSADGARGLRSAKPQAGWLPNRAGMVRPRCLAAFVPAVARILRDDHRPSLFVQRFNIIPLVLFQAYRHGCLAAPRWCRIGNRSNHSRKRFCAFRPAAALVLNHSSLESSDAM